MKRLLFLAFPVVLISCRPWKYDPGPEVTQDRQLDSFTSLSCYGEPDIEFVSDTSYLVRVIAPERLIGDVHTSVTGGRLRIEHNGWSEWYRGRAKVLIGQTVFDDIYMNGSGQLSGAPLIMNAGKIRHYGSGDMDLIITSTSLKVEMVGSGDARLTGSAANAELNTNGSGDINAIDFPVTSALVKVSGSGDVKVHASDTLQVIISGSGDVRYRGNPSVMNVTITGSGNLIHVQ
jgi:hypothetical protein